MGHVRTEDYARAINQALIKGYVLDAALPTLSFSWEDRAGTLCTLTVQPVGDSLTKHQNLLGNCLQIKRDVWKKYQYLSDY